MNEKDIKRQCLDKTRYAKSTLAEKEYLPNFQNYIERKFAFIIVKSAPDII